MEALLALLAIAVTSGIGAYFGSYLRKKGENLATKEDLQNLVDEQAQIRIAIQRIEHGGWIRRDRSDHPAVPRDPEEPEQPA